MESRKKTQTQWSNEYNAKAYDRLNILVPKGRKAMLQAAADAVGESVNQYTNKALLARMGLEAWVDVEGEKLPEEAEGAAREGLE